MFSVPPIASVVLFLVLWWGSVLPRPHVTVAWVLVGVLTQSLARAFSPLWVVGLLLNVGTAIYLSIRLRLNW
jgi:hypothetical protein